LDGSSSEWWKQQLMRPCRLRVSRLMASDGIDLLDMWKDVFD
jgi:hypothetical protein